MPAPDECRNITERFIPLLQDERVPPFLKGVLQKVWNYTYMRVWLKNFTLSGVGKRERY